jgi:hypothetical protein
MIEIKIFLIVLALTLVGVILLCIKVVKQQNKIIDLFKRLEEQSKVAKTMNELARNEIRENIKLLKILKNEKV